MTSTDSASTAAAAGAVPATSERVPVRQSNLIASVVNVDVPTTGEAAVGVASDLSGVGYSGLEELLARLAADEFDDRIPIFEVPRALRNQLQVSS